MRRRWQRVRCTRRPEHRWAEFTPSDMKVDELAEPAAEHASITTAWYVGPPFECRQASKHAPSMHSYTQFQDEPRGLVSHCDVGNNVAAARHADYCCWRKSMEILNLLSRIRQFPSGITNTTAGKRKRSVCWKSERGFNGQRGYSSSKGVSSRAPVANSFWRIKNADFARISEKIPINR